MVPVGPLSGCANDTLETQSGHIPGTSRRLSYHMTHMTTCMSTYLISMVPSLPGLFALLFTGWEIFGHCRRPINFIFSGHSGFDPASFSMSPSYVQVHLQVHHLISLGGWNDVIYLSIYPSMSYLLFYMSYLLFYMSYLLSLTSPAVLQHLVALSPPFPPPSCNCPTDLWGPRTASTTPITLETPRTPMP
jgi:hypothetical protein